MKLLANNSYGWQILERRQDTVAKNLNNVKTHSAWNGKMFKGLNHITDQLYDAELVKPEIKHREQSTVSIFIPQYGKQKLLELYYNFFQNFWDAEKYEEF